MMSTTCTHTTQAEQIAREIEPIMRRFVAQEVARLTPSLTPAQVKAARADREILDASTKVGLATDGLLQARFSGAGEILARNKLLTATRQLHSLMKKHGRLP